VQLPGSWLVWSLSLKRGTYGALAADPSSRLNALHE
jgi:hypothetical protein